MDLSVRHVAQRSRYLTNIQKGFKNIQKSIAMLPHLAAGANHTARDIQNFGPFWLFKIQGGGECPICPPDKNTASGVHKLERIQLFNASVSVSLDLRSRTVSP